MLAGSDGQRLCPKIFMIQRIFGALCMYIYIHKCVCVYALVYVRTNPTRIIDEWAVFRISTLYELVRIHTHMHTNRLAGFRVSSLSKRSMASLDCLLKCCLSTRGRSVGLNWSYLHICVCLCIHMWLYVMYVCKYSRDSHIYSHI